MLLSIACCTIACADSHLQETYHQGAEVRHRKITLFGATLFAQSGEAVRLVSKGNGQKKR